MADDIVREFLTESNENLDTLDRELVLLEKDPQNHNILGSVFRSIHTIKGTCGFLGFTKLEKVACMSQAFREPSLSWVTFDLRSDGGYEIQVDRDDARRGRGHAAPRGCRIRANRTP